jgi:hypothetical protein
MTASAASAAANGFTCSGGTFTSPTVIPAGTYRSVTIVGICAPGPGTVNVQKGLTVEPGGGFDATTASATVTIHGSVTVEPGGIFAMGCGPTNEPSSNCADNPSLTSNDSIGNNLSAKDPLLLVIHHDTIGGQARVNGTSGGMTCNNIPGAGTPPFVDFDTNVIGGNASVMGLRTCWDGFSNNKVAKNVHFKNNQTVLSDGNYLGGNQIERNLICFRNSPRPHLSDITPVPNTVGRHTKGQCAHEV